MPEHPGFDLNRINGRSIVRLRVRPSRAGAAGEALQLPQQALQWQDGDPASHWLGPDQWLLTSDTIAAKDIISHIDTALTGQLFAATDMSSSNACFALSGRAARMVLAMGCGIDMHENEFRTGQCVRTNFASVPLFIVAVDEHSFVLYVDRSYARYLDKWFAGAGEDPMTRDAKFHQITVS
jgi:sarcosine oxidase subunit gamma